MPLKAKGTLEIGPLDYLEHLLMYVSKLHGGLPRFVNPLLERASHLLRVVPVGPSMRIPPAD